MTTSHKAFSKMFKKDISLLDWLFDLLTANLINLFKLVQSGSHKLICCSLAAFSSDLLDNQYILRQSIGETTYQYQKLVMYPDLTQPEHTVDHVSFDPIRWNFFDPKGKKLKNWDFGGKFSRFRSGWPDQGQKFLTRTHYYQKPWSTIFCQMWKLLGRWGPLLSFSSKFFQYLPAHFYRWNLVS